MRPLVVKVISKTQTTVPGAFMRGLGRSGHSKTYVHGADPMLLPARLANFNGQVEGAGMPSAVLKWACALASERRAEAAGQRPPAVVPAVGGDDGL